MFLRNVPTSSMASFTHLPGYWKDTTFRKYFGASLFGRAPLRLDYSYLINQAKTKLSLRKAKQLSFAVEITLSKSITDALLIFSKKVCGLYMWKANIFSGTLKRKLLGSRIRKVVKLNMYKSLVHFLFLLSL